MLTLNPSLSPEDAETHAKPEFCRLARLSLEHRLAPYPFLHLQPNGDTSGSRWWKTRTRELVEEVGFDAVARKLACVQFMPYHSTKFKKSRSLLPSQNYSFNLVRKAMERKAEIVVMRSDALWINAIPELANYKHLHCAANPRSPYLSRGNLKGSFNTVAQRLLEKGQPTISPAETFGWLDWKFFERRAVAAFSKPMPPSPVFSKRFTS